MKSLREYIDILEAIEHGVSEGINFYDRFGHDTGPQTLPYTVEVRDRETGGKKLISIQAVSAANARERARDRGYRVVRVVSQDESDVREGAPELLKAEMPLVRHIERELAQHGYEKGTEEYKKMFDYALSYYRKFSNVDAIKKGVAEGSEEQVYKVVAVDKSNALKKPTKLNVKASSIEDVFSRLAANDWYALSINGVEVVGGKRLKQGVAEGFMDTLKGAAKEFTRDSLQKKIKQAWENTFWPKHIEPALNRIQIDGQPFRRMVLGEPRVIENDRSKNAILKQYTVNIVFPIDPQQWAGDEIKYLEAQLRDIEDGDWNPKVHGLGLVSFDQPMKSFQYTKGPVPDLVIPVRITSLDINRSLVGEQGVAEGSEGLEETPEDPIERIDRLFRDK